MRRTRNGRYYTNRPHGTTSSVSSSCLPGRCACPAWWATTTRDRCFRTRRNSATLRTHFRKSSRTRRRVSGCFSSVKSVLREIKKKVSVSYGQSGRRNVVIGKYSPSKSITVSMSSNRPNFRSWSDWVSLDMDGDALTSMSHGFKSASIITSYPYISKHRLSFMITFCTLFREFIIIP